MIYRNVGTLIGHQETATLPPTASVLDAARLMAERRVGAVAVLEEADLVGLFTERDLLNRVVALSRDPQSVTLAEVMTADPKTIGDEQPLVDALDIMFDHRVRHLPVLDAGGHLVGVMSFRDVPAAYRVLRERWVSARASDLDTAA
jgi:CBS domain-containing protein